MAMTPEGKVKKAVKQKLAEHGVYFFMPVQNGMGRVGIPDFIACVPVMVTAAMVGKPVGLFLAVETKAEGKSSALTPNQRREIEAIGASSGVAGVVENMDQLQVLLGRIYACS